eukprot:TRINITY_DN12133_c0_g1_i5.p1 TRINITY_DN12133_c0_g1~~TRINITY_DN12133_c0_g1_i5.p1  ORF type:complete len:1314 (-),score=134.90 TRINITY_DN12133_c0_g1_i5:23-3964(-)
MRTCHVCWLMFVCVFDISGVTATEDFVLGAYGPFTSVDSHYMSTIVLADLDFRKNYEPNLVMRFGPPIVNVPNLHPKLRIRTQIGTSDSAENVGVGTVLDFFLGLNGRDKINGLIGGYHSGITLPIANVAAVMNIPQISYAASSPKLSNKVSYPYFMRTFPPDSLQASAIWIFMRQFQIPYSTAIYTRDAYAEGIFFYLTNLASKAQQAFRLSGIGVKDMPMDYNVTYARDQASLAKGAPSKTLLLIMTAFQFTVFLYVLELEGMLSGSWQLLASEGCLLTPTDLRPAALPVGFLRFQPLMKGAPFSKVEDMWLKMTADDVVGPDAFTYYGLDKFKVQIEDARVAPPTNSTFQDISIFDVIDPCIFDAFYSFVFAFNALLNDGKNVSDIKGKVLLEQLKRTDFHGASGSVLFDVNGDRLATFAVKNSQPSLDGFSNSTVLVTAGVFDAVLRSINILPAAELYWADGKPGKALPAKFSVCEAGSARDDETGSCQKCAPGTVSAGGHQPCVRCPSGAQANMQRGATACVECIPGTFASESGSTECQRCQPGSFRKTSGGTSCERCEIGFFQERSGMLNCTECPTNQATAFHGAANASSCMCKAAFFRESPQHDCQTCPSGMICEIGSDMSLYFSWQSAGQPQKPAHVVFPMLRVGYASMASDPINVFRCLDVGRCPGGIPGVCGARLRLDLISCARCEQGWFWSGRECSQCSSVDQSGLLFPWLPLLLGPGIISLLYFRFFDDVEKWGSWQNGVSSLAFIAFNHYQMTKLGYNANIDWPEFVSKYMSVWAFSDDLLTLLKPECAGITSIQQTVALRAMTPVAGGVMFFLTFAASYAVQHFVRRPVRMQIGRLLNLFFSLILTFFAGIAAMCLDTFKCHSNPNGLRTLNADESIICGGSTWQEVAAVSTVAATVYLGGLGALFTWAVIVSPRRFEDARFRLMWKFLFIKNRPEVYWWSLPFILKGVLLNVVFTLFDTGVWQVATIMAVVGLYLACEVHWFPWRHIGVNYLDFFSHLALILILALSLWFARESVSDEAIVLSVSRGVSTSIVIVSMSPLVLAALLAWSLCRWQLGPAEHEKRAETIVRMANHLEALVALEQEALTRFVSGISPWDLFYIEKASNVLWVEFAGVISRRATAKLVTRTHLSSFSRRMQGHELPIDESSERVCNHVNTSASSRILASASPLGDEGHWSTDSTFQAGEIEAEEQLGTDIEAGEVEGHELPIDESSERVCNHVNTSASSRILASASPLGDEGHWSTDSTFQAGEIEAEEQLGTDIEAGEVEDLLHTFESREIDDITHPGVKSVHAKGVTASK